MKKKRLTSGWNVGDSHAKLKLSIGNSSEAISRKQSAEAPPRPEKANPSPHMLFPHPRTHIGGCNPHAISPLIEIELWDENQTNHWDVLSPMVPELTSSGYSLSPPGRGKEKKSDLRIYRFSQITFELRKIAE